MSQTNPFEYYTNEDNQGSYQYIALEHLVNNFMQQYTGDDKLLGHTKRHNVLYWMKKGIQQFTFSALKEIKAVELELGDAYDIIMPPDYVNYVRISWLNTQTGEFHPMSENKKLTIATSYLQDHKAEILFDNNGYVLEGTSATEIINKKLDGHEGYRHLNCCEDTQNFGIDTSKNYNGNFNIEKRTGRIHFSSEVASKIIILEYISDGLEYESESNIMVHKYAEIALYDWVKWNMLTNKIGVQDYEKRRAKSDYDTAFRNAKVKLMDIKIADVMQLLKERNKWLR